MLGVSGRFRASKASRTPWFVNAYAYFKGGTKIRVEESVRGRFAPRPAERAGETRGLQEAGSNTPPGSPLAVF